MRPAFLLRFIIACLAILHGVSGVSHAQDIYLKQNGGGSGSGGSPYYQGGGGSSGTENGANSIVQGSGTQSGSEDEPTLYVKREGGPVYNYTPGELLKPPGLTDKEKRQLDIEDRRRQNAEAAVEESNRIAQETEKQIAEIRARNQKIAEDNQAAWEKEQQAAEATDGNAGKNTDSSPSVRRVLSSQSSAQSSSGSGAGTAVRASKKTSGASSGIGGRVFSLD